MKWGPIFKAGFANRLQFAGEHTCYAFMGYMEGALTSGYRVASRIAIRDTVGLGRTS
jgi:monoamine oxidase